MKQPLKSLLMVIFFSFLQTVNGQLYQVSSPDGKTSLELTTGSDRRLIYRISFEGKPLIRSSEMGFRIGEMNAGENVTLSKPLKKSVREEFSWTLGENRTIQSHYEELILPCRSSGFDFRVIARVFDGSVAFRYEIPQQKGFSGGQIHHEKTTFVLAKAGTIYEYHEESAFTPTLVDKLQKTCDFPATITGEGSFISIGEADNRSYTKAVLSKGDVPNALRITFQKDSVVAGSTFAFPWRTVSFSTSAVGLHRFSELPLKLCEPLAPEIPAWIIPGKLIRSSLTTQGGLNCIDFAVAHDFKYIMFDAGWYGAEFRTTSDPTLVIDAIDMPGVIAYGKEKGIGVILYVNRVALRARLDEILPLYKKWGVAGLKFGFVDGLSQEGITWLYGAMKKVYDHGFVLNIHDNYKPTGLSRTFPNLLTQEGIRGNENNPDAYHNMVLPFTRYLAGAADYTYCYPNTNRYFTDNLYKSKLQVSKGQQLALSVVYFSPLQAIFWYGNPTDYNDKTETEFFKRVPTVWDESHYLSGEIGKYISVARRSGTTWYAGVAAGPEDYEDRLSLKFLERGEKYHVTTYEDDGLGGILKKESELTTGEDYKVSIKAKGGQAFIFEKR